MLLEVLEYLQVGRAGGVEGGAADALVWLGGGVVRGVVRVVG